MQADSEGVARVLDSTFDFLNGRVGCGTVQ